MYTFIDEKLINDVGMLKLYQHQNGTFKVTIETASGEYEARWSEQENAYEMYTNVVDFNTMVKHFQLEGLV